MSAQVSIASGYTPEVRYDLEKAKEIGAAVIGVWKDPVNGSVRSGIVKWQELPPVNQEASESAGEAAEYAWCWYHGSSTDDQISGTGFHGIATFELLAYVPNIPFVIA